MSVVKSQIKELIDNQELSPRRRVDNLVHHCQTSSLQELQYIVRELSYLLYQKNTECSSHIIILEFFKILLLTGSFPAYLFFHVYIAPWLLSIGEFYKDRPLLKRCELMYRDAVGDKSNMSKDALDSYKQMLTFAEEFIVFFGEQLKYHPYSKYKIKNRLYRKGKQHGYTHQLDHFTEEDKTRLGKCLSEYSPVFREHLKALTQFISDKVEECLTQPTCYQETAFLLAGMVELAQSYCITTLLYRTCNYIVPPFLTTTCDFLHSIYSLGQIEAIEIANCKCLPLVLEYLLPVDFKNNQILPSVKHQISSEVLNKLVDYYHIWHDMTRLVGLSTRIYEQSCEMVSWLKKPNKLAYQPEIKEFSNKINKMRHSNDTKRSFVIDQNLELENYIVNILKDTNFCLSSQNKQRAAYENILDELTITESDSDRMNSFSRSMLQSSHEEEDKQHRRSAKKGKAVGLLKKRFTQSDSSISDISSSGAHNAKFPDIDLSQKEELQRDNIYYSGKSQKTASFNRKSPELRYQNKFQGSDQRVQYSSKHVHEPSARAVYAHNSSTPQKTPASSSRQSSFLNSSQFSYKQNKKKDNIESVYLNKEISNEDSGSFVNFDAYSIVKSEKQQKDLVPTFPEFGNEGSQIYFEDSIQIKKSQNELIEYGMDKDARLPKSVKKPKFAFSCDTNDSSMIIKDLNLSPPKSRQKQQITTPYEFTPMSKNALISVNSNHADKRTQNTKAPMRSQSNRSLNSRQEDLVMFKKKSENQKIQKVKNIYLTKEVVSDDSQIHPNSIQPYSQSLSSEKSSVPSNFSGVFKRKQKRQKASSLSSSLRSLPKVKLMNKPVEMPDLKKMHELERQLGQLKLQTEEYQKLLKEKEKEKKTLQAKTQEIIQQDPYFLKKENEIIKQMLKQNKNDQSLRSSQSSRRLGKELRESSIRSRMSLKNYKSQVLKLRLPKIKGYSKPVKKNIISNRCFLINNELLQIGYSLKQKVMTLYFTLKHHCDSLQIDLNENSVIYSESIQRQFDKIMVDKQLKFKTEVKGTRDQEVFLPSILHIRVAYEERLQKKEEVYMLELPLTPYNLATPIKCSFSDTNTFYQDSGTPYVTTLYNSCQDLLKKGKKYLDHIFPYGQYDQDSNTFLISYLWKDHTQRIKIKLKERVFRVEGMGRPTQSGRQLIETVIDLLTEPTS